MSRPSADAGWYDYQLYALETLLLPERGPESQNLLLTAGYKKKLIETFKSILIQTRETHVKQAVGGARRRSGAAPPPVDIYPLLPAEPFPTFYLRTARAYRFLQARSCRRRWARRSSPRPSASSSPAPGERRRSPAELDSEWPCSTGWLHDADAVGMARDAGTAARRAGRDRRRGRGTAARAWLATWRPTRTSCAIRASSSRCSSTSSAKLMTYWAVIGVKALIARAEFVPGHEPICRHRRPAGPGSSSPRYTLLVEETAELGLPYSPARRPRATSCARICDAHATKDADRPSALDAR